MAFRQPIMSGINTMQGAQPMSKFGRYAFSASPLFDEAQTREAFSHAVPLKTLVIYCYDPRATEIPQAVARLLGDEVFPGQVMLDESGNRVASSTTMFPVIVAGGRAIDALRSITVAQHLFGIQNIVVVHHSYCGATSFTADGIVDAYKHEHNIDISELYERGSICIENYEVSLKRDTALIRSHAGTPKHVNVFGYFYNIDTGVLTEVVKDKAETILIPAASHGGGAINNGTHASIASQDVLPCGAQLPTWNKSCWNVSEKKGKAQSWAIPFL
jgi:carbonic anhydrase